MALVRANDQHTSAAAACTPCTPFVANAESAVGRSAADLGPVECCARCGRSAQTRLQAQARGAGQGAFRIARLGALVEDSLEEADKQGTYLAIRSWADATLSWIIPFYGSLKTLWLLWVLVNSNMVRGTGKQRH